jgi:hypothetical protein
MAAEREQLARVAIVESLEGNRLARAHQCHEPLVARDPEARARAADVSGMAGERRSIHCSVVTNFTGIYEQKRTARRKVGHPSNFCGPGPFAPAVSNQELIRTLKAAIVRRLLLGAALIGALALAVPTLAASAHVPCGKHKPRRSNCGKHLGQLKHHLTHHGPTGATGSTRQTGQTGASGATGPTGGSRHVPCGKHKPRHSNCGKHLGQLEQQAPAGATGASGATGSTGGSTGSTGASGSTGVTAAAAPTPKKDHGKGQGDGGGHA